MQIESVLDVALKEWAVIVAALERGEQTILLRKGGIADRGGRFEARHGAFLLYPTAEHQRPEAVKEPFRKAFPQPPPSARPGGDSTIAFTSAARVVDVAAIPDHRTLEALDPEHILSAGEASARWRYKPDRPLVLLLLRVFRLAQALEVPVLPRYAGCRSWVPLESALSLPASIPALNDADFESARARILDRLAR